MIDLKVSVFESESFIMLSNSQKDTPVVAIPVFLWNDSVELQNQILKFAPH